MAIRIQDYGYINARVRAMGASLFNQDTYNQMLKIEKLSLLINFLQSSDYAQDIQEAGTIYAKEMNLRIWEEALKLNFCRTIQKIQKIVAGEPKILINLSLKKWDLYNLKTILRGKHSQQSPALILKNLFLFGEYGQDFYENLLKEANIPALINELGRSSFFSPPGEKKRGKDYNFPSSLSENLKNYQTTGNLLVLELTLDKWYYSTLLKTTKKMGDNYKLVYQVIEEEIDILNLSTLLRISRERLPLAKVKEFFIPGGTKIAEDQFENLAKLAGAAEIIERVKFLSFSKEIEGRWNLYEKREEISIIERGLEASLTRKIWRGYRKNVLGFNVILGYLRVKYNEFINLRIIGRAKEFGMPEENLREELIFV